MLVASSPNAATVLFPIAADADEDRGAGERQKQTVYLAERVLLGSDATIVHCHADRRCRLFHFAQDDGKISHTRSTALLPDSPNRRRLQARQ